MATVQDYLNMAVSMTIGNKSGTDNQFRLPNDFRKYEDLKVKNFSVNTHTLAISGAASSIAVDQFDADEALVLVFGSHPFSVFRFNGSALGATEQVYASFFGFGRDRAGDANLQATNVIAIANDLNTPNFVSTSGGDVEPLSIIVVQVAFES